MLVTFLYVIVMKVINHQPITKPLYYTRDAILIDVPEPKRVDKLIGDAELTVDIKLEQFDEYIRIIVNKIN